MSVAFDTSVVLRLLTGEPPEQAEAARRFLAERRTTVTIDSLVVGESYFALHHHYGVPHRDALDALIALLSSERIAGPPRVRDALIEARTREQPGVMDRLILAAAGAWQQELMTFDKRLAQLEGATLLR